MEANFSKLSSTPSGPPLDLDDDIQCLTQNRFRTSSPNPSSANRASSSQHSGSANNYEEDWLAANGYNDQDEDLNSQGSEGQGSIHNEENDSDHQSYQSSEADEGSDRSRVEEEEPEGDPNDSFGSVTSISSSLARRVDEDDVDGQSASDTSLPEENQLDPPPVLGKKVAEESTPQSTPAKGSGSVLFIPDDLREEVAVGQTSDFFVRDDEVWKVPKLPRCQQGNIPGTWTFTVDPEGGQTLTTTAKCVKEKQVQGRPLIALTKDGKRIPALLEVFSELSDPPKPSIFEAAERDYRKQAMLRFVATENSTCAKALGDWELNKDKDNSISVGKLPLELQELVKGDRPARLSSPPLSFSFSGTKDSEAAGFLDAVYGDGAKLNDYTKVGTFLTGDRLPPPRDTTVLEKLRKEMAALTRPVQCSLAVADLAKHIGGPKTVDNLSKESIKDLVQIMGILSTESAVAQMPKLDRAVALWRKEKSDLRNTITQGVRPDSLKTSLEASSLFSESFFPEKIVKEMDEKYKEQETLCFFPACDTSMNSVKRPLGAKVYDPTERKKPRRSHPSSMPPPSNNRLLKLKAQATKANHYRKVNPQPNQQASSSGQRRQGGNLPAQAPSQPKAQHGQNAAQRNPKRIIVTDIPKGKPPKPATSSGNNKGGKDKGNTNKPRGGKRGGKH